MNPAVLRPPHPHPATQEPATSIVQQCMLRQGVPPLLPPHTRGFAWAQPCCCHCAANTRAPGSLGQERAVTSN